MADNEFSWDLDIVSMGPRSVDAFQLAHGLQCTLQPHCTVIFDGEDNEFDLDPDGRLARLNFGLY
jgi:hypothetical protein